MGEECEDRAAEEYNGVNCTYTKEVDIRVTLSRLWESTTNEKL